MASTRIVRSEGGSARRERLLRETKRAAQVKHQGLAEVLEVGQTEDGDVFVRVETIEGERLTDRLRQGALPEAVAAAIALQIARALAAAHDAGVVHRDLRPSVIALSGEGETTHVKVEGLATPRTSAEIAGDSEAAYAAPEHRRGEVVGRRADVYSIGAMLHVMLTGQAPAIGPSTPVVDIEGPLADVVRRCIADDPRERFLDTIALGAALCLAMEAPAAAPPPPKRVSAPVPAGIAPSIVDPETEAASAAALASPSSERPAPPSLRPSQRPTSQRPLSLTPSRAAAADASETTAPLARPPAAPPPRPLGRPLTARPRWEEALLDLSDGPLPRVVLVLVVTFVIARILTSGIVPFVVAVAAAVAAYATWRRSHTRR